MIRWIQVAVRYYDTHEDALLQGWAYYYWGCVYRDMKKARGSRYQLSYSEHLSKKTKTFVCKALSAII